jgi:hypothetical protein
MNTLSLNLREYADAVARDYAEACAEDGLKEADIDVADTARRFIEDAVFDMPNLSQTEIAMMSAFFAMTLLNYIRSI